MTAFDWTPIRYRNVISVLKNPFYAGAYAYGKSVSRTQIVDGRARKTYGHYRPLRDCEILLKDHHESYIDWEEFERNQTQLAANAYGRKDGAKSRRGGRDFPFAHALIYGHFHRRPHQLAADSYRAAQSEAL
jgi:hypothetical protein